MLPNVNYTIEVVKLHPCHALS